MKKRHKFYFLVISLMLIFFFVSNALLAQNDVKMKQLNKELIPLGNYLDPDGTLNIPKDFKGSLDPKGWKLDDVKGGRLHFVKDKSHEEMKKFRSRKSQIEKMKMN